MQNCRAIPGEILAKPTRIIGIVAGLHLFPVVAVFHRAFDPSPRDEILGITQIANVELIGNLAYIALPVLHDQAPAFVIENLLLELRDHPKIHIDTGRHIRLPGFDAQRLGQIIKPVCPFRQSFFVPSCQS